MTYPPICSTPSRVRNFAPTRLLSSPFRLEGIRYSPPTFFSIGFMATICILPPLFVTVPLLIRPHSPFLTCAPPFTSTLQLCEAMAISFPSLRGATAIRPLSACRGARLHIIACALHGGPLLVFIRPHADFDLPNIHFFFFITSACPDLIVRDFSAP